MLNAKPLPVTVMVFAGLDATGGAGLAADSLAIASIGAHALPVITTVTVQDSEGVHSFHPLPAAWIIAQARAVLADMPVAAFKLGVLGSEEIVRAVADLLKDFPEIPVVCDPVLASGRGDPLAQPALIQALQGALLPLTTVITPNVSELRVLGGVELSAQSAAEHTIASINTLLALGARNVLLTGTHAATLVVCNSLYGHSGLIHTQQWARLPASYHGSGCTLAAALAGLLARGLSIADAALHAQRYTYATLCAGFALGAGQPQPERLCVGVAGRSAAELEQWLSGLPHPLTNDLT